MHPLNPVQRNNPRRRSRTSNPSCRAEIPSNFGRRGAKPRRHSTLGHLGVQLRLPAKKRRADKVAQPSAARSSDQEVMRHLSRSEIFKDYERAFSEAVGLPLNIRGRDSWSPSHHGKADHDSFAAILARFNKARAACLKAQTDASREPDSAKRTVT
jgi:hypothetical protein